MTNSFFFAFSMDGHRKAAGVASRRSELLINLVVRYRGAAPEFGQDRFAALLEAKRELRVRQQPDL
jgi:hypothetical protein